MTGFGLAAQLVLWVGLQATAGAWAWAWVRRRSGRMERVGGGLALGTALAALAGAGLFAVTPWAWLAPAAACAAAAPVVRVRSGKWVPQPGAGVGRAGTVAALAGLLAGGIFVTWSLRSYPLQPASVVGTYHGDMPFFEALSRSLGSLGPSQSIFMSGSRVRYHWLTYAWAGQLSEATDALPFLVLTRVLPTVVLLSTVLLAVAWARRLSRHPWVPTIAAVLVVAGGYVGASFGTVLNFDSPSQQLTTVWILAGALAFLAALTARRPLVPLLGFTALAAAATAGKVSAGAVLLAGAAGVALVASLRRQAHAARAWWTLSIGLLGAIAAFGAWIAGAADVGGLRLGLLDKMSSVIGINPITGTVGVIAGTGLLLLAIAARWAGVTWLLRDPRRRWALSTVLGVSMAAFGLLAIVALGQGVNDSWFALSASAPLSVLSAAGAGRALRRAGMPGARPTQTPVLLALAGALGSALAFIAWGLPDDRGRWAAVLLAMAAAALAGLVLASGPVRVRVALGLTIGLLTAASLARLLPFAGSLVSTREGTRQPTEFSIGIADFTPLDPDWVRSWGPIELEAAHWLHERTSTSDIIATNRTLSPFVPAVVGRPMYLAGSQYQAPYGPRGSLGEVIARDAASYAFIDEPSAASLAPLCEAGVTWLWIDPALALATTWEPYATIERSEPTVTIARITGC